MPGKTMMTRPATTSHEQDVGSAGDYSNNCPSLHEPASDDQDHGHSHAKGARETLNSNSDSTATVEDDVIDTAEPTTEGDDYEKAAAGAEVAAMIKATAAAPDHEGILNRVLSRTSAKSWTPSPPPNGGWKAWLACAGTHFVVMNTWGMINSFGTFQTYYRTLLDRPPSDIAWIGSFQIFLLFFVGTFTGRLTDAGYFRILFVTGTCLQVVGIFTTAQATKFWHFFLSQGVTMGLGNGCLFCPTLTILSTYFSTRRSLAIGLSAAGSATGGLVYPSIVRQLLPSVGFSWTMRTIGFIQLATLVVAGASLHPRLPPRRSGSIIEWAAFKETPYAFYAGGAFFSFWGVYVAFFYVASFARDKIGLSYTDSLNLLLVLNGVGLIGRTLPNYLADRLGAVNMFLIFVFYACIGAYCWSAVHSSAGMYVWTVFYGIAAGGIQSLFPAGLASLTTDLRKAGVRMGMVFTINSFATLTGPPIVGAIISAGGGSYLGCQMFTGSTLLIGALCLLGSKLALGRKTGRGVKAKV